MSLTTEAAENGPLIECFFTTNEGAPYLARFWRDVGINGCWRESAGCT